MTGSKSVNIQTRTSHYTFSLTIISVKPPPRRYFFFSNAEEFSPACAWEVGINRDPIVCVGVWCTILPGVGPENRRCLRGGGGGGRGGGWGGLSAMTWFEKMPAARLMIPHLNAKCRRPFVPLLNHDRCLANTPSRRWVRAGSTQKKCDVALRRSRRHPSLTRQTLAGAPRDEVDVFRWSSAR